MTARIAILVEGKTEVAFRPALLNYLRLKLAGKMPKPDFVPQDGRVPKEARLKRLVSLLLKQNDCVIALTDVYTGTTPYEFTDAADAKNKMHRWVGRESRFYAHAAQFEFEAWLLPYWSRIQQYAGTDRNSPSSNPETVNHDKPPARILAELFRTGHNKRAYSKARDAAAILRGKDLEISADACPELRAFLDTILKIATIQA